jgi:hypothetical protein
MITTTYADLRLLLQPKRSRAWQWAADLVFLTTKCAYCKS